MPPPRDPSTRGSVRNPADIDSGQYDEQKIWQRYFDNWNQQFRPQPHFGVGPGASATGQSGLAHTSPETLAPIGTTGSTAGLGVSPGAAGLGGAGGAAGSISGAGAGGAGFWGKVGSMAGGNYGQWINTGIGAIGSYLDSKAAQNASKNAGKVDLWSEENPWGPSVDYRTAGMEQALAALRNQSAGGAAPGGRGGGGGAVGVVLLTNGGTRSRARPETPMRSWRICVVAAKVDTRSTVPRISSRRDCSRDRARTRCAAHKC